MSLASTTVYLYIGFDEERRRKGGEWPAGSCGHFELVDMLETRAEQLESMYDEHFGSLNLGCVFDYEVTEDLGAWLYTRSETLGHEACGAFEQEAWRLVRAVQAADAARSAE